MTELVVFASGFALAWAVTELMPKGVWRHLAVRNYRGLVLTSGLGISLAIAALVPGFISSISAAFQGEHGLVAGLAFEGGCALVFLAGLIDDLVGKGPRGLRAHLVAAAKGRFTTGSLKIALIVGAAALIVFTGPMGTQRMVAGMVLMPAFANLWNGLDVVPGRAAKSFVVGAWVTATFATSVSHLLLRMLGAAVFVGWLDLRERGMLGDSGANLLGFALAVSLYRILSPPVLIGLAVVGLALNVLAETFTLSRIIDATPPLRWFDLLGRLRLDQEDPASREDSSIE